VAASGVPGRGGATRNASDLRPLPLLRNPLYLGGNVFIFLRGRLAARILSSCGRQMAKIGDDSLRIVIPQFCRRSCRT
jgi:hypothetical protein